MKMATSSTMSTRSVSVSISCSCASIALRMRSTFASPLVWLADGPSGSGMRGSSVRAAGALRRIARGGYQVGLIDRHAAERWGKLHPPQRTGVMATHTADQPVADGFGELHDVPYIHGRSP